MRNSILSSALSVSMEGLDDGQMDEINPVTAETVLQLDQTLEDVRDTGATVDQADDAVEELSDAAASMEAMIVSLESFIAGGGMSPQTAHMHSVGMANAVRRLPISAGEFVVSTESFGGTGDKLQASMEALEGAKALLAKIWEGIKNAITSAWDALKSFFASIGKSGPAVVAAGQSLKKRAIAQKGQAAVVFNASIWSGKALQTLIVDGKADPVGALAAINTGYTVGVEQYTNKVLAQLNPLYAAVQQGAVTPERLKEAASKIDLKACLSKSMKGELPGGYYFDMKVSDEYLNGGTDLAVLSKSKMSFERDASKDVKSAPQAPMSVDIIASIADEVIKMGQLMIKSKGVASAAEKGMQAAVKAGNSLVGKGDTLSKEEQNASKGILAQLNKAARLCSGCSHQYLSYMGTSAKTAVSFCSQALKAYGKGDAKAKKDEAAQA